MKRIEEKYTYVDVAIFDELLVSSDNENVLLIVVVSFISRVGPSVSQEIRRFLLIQLKIIISAGNITFLYFIATYFRFVEVLGQHERRFHTNFADFIRSQFLPSFIINHLNHLNN